ncbi:unnamed protein product [Pieris brassicae]|uniref:Uncharacterized protein n=1 Tax=Pieris brassicae TaxID=7116 RepID=A0A9P0XAH3_PIEBR|nr:unnamed protein product [Pieris brassicae]
MLHYGYNEELQVKTDNSYMGYTLYGDTRGGLPAEITSRANDTKYGWPIDSGLWAVAWGIWQDRYATAQPGGRHARPHPLYCACFTPPLLPTLACPRANS